ncbi:MAG: flagellar biosynthesis protein FlhF [Pseudomonadota bacterium]
MKIRRFFASDMRQALRQVRETLGADAVILSNKSVEGGVELVAAMDFAEEAFAAPETPSRVREQSASTTLPDTAEPIKSEFKSFIKPEARSDSAAFSKPAATPDSRWLDKKPPSTLQAKRNVEWSQDPVLQEMRQEMHALRRMMENELSELTWRDLGQRRPQTQELIRRLMGLGLGAGICRDLAARVEDADTPDKAWRQALFQLISEIPIMQGDLLDQGGIIALVGPTGVGKTTTIAKLAARFCLRHGNRQLALVTTDSYRIGAQEQLHNYGRILDVPVRTAANSEELSAALHALSEKRLVLIDTAGMGQRDLQLSQRLTMLSSGNHPVKTLLTLSATTQRSAIAHAIRSFSVARPIGAVLTKMDEAASLGGVLSSLMEARLALSFVSDGQRVPEDLHVARANTLVSQAVELGKTLDESPDEDYLALAFGGMGENAHV